MPPKKTTNRPVASRSKTPENLVPSDSEPQGLFHQPNNPDNNPADPDDDPDANRLAAETTATLAEAIMPTWYSQHFPLTMVKPPCTLPTANDKTVGGRFLKISIRKGPAAF
jgi:hypothetical protein